MDATAPARHRMDSAPDPRRPRRLGAKITLIFALLAIPWAWSSYQTHQTLREIERLHGFGVQRYQFNPASWRLPGDWIYLGPIDEISFRGPEVGDESLRVLQRTPSIRVLSLIDARITDEGLAMIGQHRKLIAVAIVAPGGAKEDGAGARPITADGLRHLEALPKLQLLDLTGQSITDEDIPALARLKQLTLILLDQTLVTPAGAAALKAALPGCQVQAGR